MEKNSAPEKKVRISKAQENKFYVAKLKAAGKYEEYKKNRAAKAKLYRERKKTEESKMPLKNKINVIVKRRRETIERTQKCRAQKAAKLKENISSLTGVARDGYRSIQTLGKAVRKADRAFPKSPTKKKAVMANIFCNMSEADQIDLRTVILAPPPPKKKAIPDVLKVTKAVREFYARDDVSRVSPRIRDVNEYICETGEKILIPTRHMIVTCKEAYTLFNEEQEKLGNGTCGTTFFNQHRPDHIKLIGELPHNMCLCSYHSNFIDAVSALHTFVSKVPDYKNGFIQQFLCDGSTIDCWYGQCNQCSGITISKLTDLVGAGYLGIKVSWMEWKKCSDMNRTERRRQTGKMTDLLSHIAAMSTKFLIHSFNTREQSETFNLHDLSRALNVDYAVEGLMQVDFAENFVCANQDEVQNAHWNQRQLTVFTSGLYYNESFEAKVLISNNLSHTKESIFTYLWVLFKKLPRTIRILKIWSDGPSSQFKNKYIASLIVHFENIFQIKIVWNYFATSHGKGCVDGIGATVKKIVRKHIRARDIIVNDASDFVRAVLMTPSKILVEEVTEKQIDMKNAESKTIELFANSKPIPKISSTHQIQTREKKIVTFCISKQGYN